MTADGRNESMTVLDDCICELGPSAGVESTRPWNLGRAERMVVLDEVTFRIPEATRAARGDEVQIGIRDLIAAIARSADPSSTVSEVRSVLEVEFARIQSQRTD